MDAPWDHRLVGENIRRARLARTPPRGQRWLADRLGVSQPTISRWEQGRADISVRNLDVIARALDVDAKDLLNDGGVR